MTDTPRTGDQQRLGILLAGGRSRRFGQDKAQAALPGTSGTLLTRALDLLRPHVDACLLVRSQECPELPGDVAQIVDPQEGPLQALRLALRHPADRYWVAPCDMPFLHADLYLTLEREAGGRAGACYRGPRGLEPLVSVLTAEGARDLLGWTDADAPLRRIFEELDIANVDASSGCRPASEGSDTFLNVNTPADWQVALGALPSGLVEANP